MGACIMNERAKLILVFGVPMSTQGVDPIEHQMSRRDFDDDDRDAMDEAFVRGVRPGLMSLGDSNYSSVVFGIPVKVMDLHDKSHHLPYPSLSDKDLARLQKQFDALWKAAPSRLRTALNKLSRAKPKPILVLDIE